MTLGWYNGWSPAERLAVIPVQREAVRTGVLPRPSRCSICNIAHERGGSSPVWLHDENYAEPLTAYPICRRCHRILHERFEIPKPWLGLVALHGSGNCWFEALTMDRASLQQRFEVTYPKGLRQSEQPTPRRRVMRIHLTRSTRVAVADVNARFDGLSGAAGHQPRLVCRHSATRT